MKKFDVNGRRLARGRWSATAVATMLVVACGGGGEDSGDATLSRQSATAGASSCLNRVNNTFEKLLECVTLDGVRRHQAALQSIADAHNGIRTSGTSGYDASLAYAAQVFRDAGYLVTITDFQFQTFITLSSTVLEQVTPGRRRRWSTTSWRTRAVAT